MNGATAKANRRDIRRAFGDNAVELIDKHAEALAEQKALLIEHEHVIAANLKVLSHLRTDHQQLRTDHLAFVSLTFWHRLRWFLTGRLA